MNAPVKLAGFAVAGLVVFGAALGIGKAVGPLDTEEPAAHDTHGDAEGEGHGEDHGSAHGAADAGGADEIPGGLMVSHDGYTLALTEARATAGTGRSVSFTISGPDGAPVTDYDVEHEKQLHLIAVRRDFTGFQHVHPTLADDGTWSTDLDLTPGDWRVFADFKPAAGDPLTLGTDLAVTGSYRPAPPAGETRTAMVDDYEVTLDGDLSAGSDARLTLSVSKDGEPVTDLEPYLGAYGHLVALRGGDLAYLHVHPDGTPGDGTTEPGPEVVFYAAVPSAGTYHLYLDFQHHGVVRTAAFTVTAGGPGAAPDDHGESSGHAH